MINVNLLRDLLDYDAGTGALTWLERPVAMFTETAQGQSAESRARAWNAAWAGKRAFTAKNKDGYLCGSITGKTMRAQRVIWALVHGYWPEGVIDHKNGRRDDNRLVNLRDVSVSINGRNQKISTRNKTGITGVHFASRERMYVATIRINGKQVSLGYFRDIEQAATARAKAEDQHGFTRRAAQRAGHQRSLAGQSRQDDMPGVQPASEEEARSVLEREPR